MKRWSRKRRVNVRRRSRRRTGGGAERGGGRGERGE